VRIRYLIPLAAIAAGGLCPTVGNAQAIQWRGNGALTATSASATISSLITSYANSQIAYAVLGSAVGNLALINDGAVDAAVCVKGGTCTCPENGAAVNTVGITLRAGGGGQQMYLPNIAYSVVTIVSCGANTIVEANW